MAREGRAAGAGGAASDGPAIVGALARHEGLVRVAAGLVVLASLVAVAAALPVESGVRLLAARLADAGALAPLAFGLVYVVATLCFVPGSILTLAAGALLGMAVGVPTVWLSATVAAALAFLIARVAVRGKVAELAARSRRVGAVDRAIERGGWRVVVLLRLSPVVPFSASNYVLGMTGVRFAPYVLASAGGMLPGSFLYVYVGWVGREGAAAAAGAGGRSAVEWALLGLGLVATVLVTVLVTRLATRALREQAGEVVAPGPGGPRRTGSARRAVAALVLAALAAGAAVLAHARRDALAELLAPPPAEEEAG